MRFQISLLILWSFFFQTGITANANSAIENFPLFYDQAPKVGDLLLAS